MRVSYKGVTGELLKLEKQPKCNDGITLNINFSSTETIYQETKRYTIIIADEKDRHRHIFENVDISEVKFTGASVSFQA